MVIRSKRGNKKIIGATPTGVYKSRLESKYAKIFLPLGFKYEGKTFTLLKPVLAGTKTRYYTGKTRLQERKSVMPTTYTPDFVLDTGHQLIVIECKGFPNDAYPIKRKLFLEYLSKLEKPSYFIEGKNESQIIAILVLIKKILSNNE